MKSVLFLCVENSSRSQMAEGLARAHFGNRVRVQSAGSRPSEINLLAIEVMAEFNIDISGQTSKSIDTIDLTSIDTVVTLCAAEVCPAFPGLTKRISWALPDPAAVTNSYAEHLQRFRDVRDEIVRHLVEL